MTDAQRRAKKKYDKVNVQQIALRLNKNTDQDILDRLSKEANKQGYIKRLIRENIEDCFNSEK